ncbi:MAG TPA: hypothetical protein VGX45_14515 [Solirubrobacteraceae bacterium]|jgi:hypothetical protein|nr:hypothetical protein [Solirubrobacteraceae bacterium]
MKAVIRGNIGALAAAAILVAGCGSSSSSSTTSATSTSKAAATRNGNSSTPIVIGAAIAKTGLRSAYDMPAWTAFQMEIASVDAPT